MFDARRFVGSKQESPYRRHTGSNQDLHSRKEAIVGQSALHVPIVVAPLAPSTDSLVGAHLADSNGALLTTARARLTVLPTGWLAVIDQMERPGVLNGYYFSRGGRQIRLQLDDGRIATGSITSASFECGRRVYHLEGSGTISRPVTLVRDVA